MQYNRRLVLMLAIMVAAFVAFALTAGAADKDPVTVTGILKAAGCPLTADQQKAFDAISEEEGMRATRTLSSTFTDEQNEALVDKLGEQTMPNFGGQGGGMGGGQGGGQGGQGGPGGGMGMGPRIRNLSQIIILEKEGVPLTEKQLADANAAAEEASQNAGQGGGMGMGMGMGGMSALNDVLTDKQAEVMEKYMSNMMGGMGGGMGGGGFGGGGF